jgi:hypothetical protein
MTSSCGMVQTGSLPCLDREYDAVWQDMPACQPHIKAYELCGVEADGAIS